MFVCFVAGCDQPQTDQDEPTASGQAQPVKPADTAGRDGDAADLPAQTASQHQYASWAGKWTGVEGMYAIITPTVPGQYRLEMQSDLDTLGTYDGRDSETGIAFSRGGKQMVLHQADGDATGLKYLAGKQNCLMTQSGEGYCR